MLLALDVGFRNSGWCAFKDGKPVAWGVIQTDKAKKKTVRMADDNAYRAGQIARQIKEIVDEHNVCAIIGELPSGGAQSARAMAQMAAATCIVGAVANILELPVEWCSPTDVKKAVTGLRSATKREVMDAVRKKFEGVDWPKTKGVFEHVADAVGAYLALRDGNLVKMFG